MSKKSDIFDDKNDLTPSDFFLISLYVKEGQPLDALAYTSAFDRLYNAFAEREKAWTKADVFRRLLLLRKSGRLPRLEFGKTG